VDDDGDSAGGRKSAHGKSGRDEEARQDSHAPIIDLR
jgi:hypothetical protein